jgi:hypothetical protein
VVPRTVTVESVASPRRAAVARPVAADAVAPHRVTVRSSNDRIPPCSYPVAASSHRRIFASPLGIGVNRGVVKGEVPLARVRERSTPRLRRPASATTVRFLEFASRGCGCHTRLSWVNASDQRRVAGVGRSIHNTGGYDGLVDPAHGGHVWQCCDHRRRAGESEPGAKPGPANLDGGASRAPSATSPHSSTQGTAEVGVGRDVREDHDGSRPGPGWSRRSTTARAPLRRARARR